MKNKKQYIIHFVLGLFLVNGCTSHQNEKNIFQDFEYQQIKEIASSSGKYFCIILVDSTFNISSYKKKISSAESTQYTIWNFVNIQTSQHSWYKYLLGSEKTPFTLVFNPNGKLRNIVYGISKYAFESIESSLRPISQKTCYEHFGFLENSAIPISPQKINSFFDRMIKIKSSSNNNEKSYYDSLTTSIKDLEYPYNLYLKINYERRHLHNDSSILHAKELLNKYGNTYYASIFKSLFLDINEQINQCVNITNKLQISVSPSSYNCHINDTLKIKVQATNNTQSAIEIRKIEPSCNCITQTGTFSMAIPPKQIVEYEFYLIPEEKGEIYREIYFHTNSDLPVAIAEFKVFVE